MTTSKALEALRLFTSYGNAMYRNDPDAAELIAKKFTAAIAELEAQGGQAGEPAAWINWSAMTGEPRLGWQCESEIASEPLYRRPKPKHRITYVCTACNFSLERQE